MLRFAELVRAFIARKELAGVWSPDAGLAVCAVRGGEPPVLAVNGLRERDRRLPVTPRTLFEIGSLTKAFTATALLMAREKGLDLEQPINSAEDLLPFKDPAISSAVTILDVLSHRTGLPANDLLWYFNALNPGEVLRAVRNLDGIPGGFRREFIYNNLAYGALGHLFPKLLGDTWRTLRIGGDG